MANGKLFSVVLEHSIQWYITHCYLFRSYYAINLNTGGPLTGYMIKINNRWKLLIPNGVYISRNIYDILVLDVNIIKKDFPNVFSYHLVNLGLGGRDNHTIESFISYMTGQNIINYQQVWVDATGMLKVNKIKNPLIS